jgi:hypothetical protein
MNGVRIQRDLPLPVGYDNFPRFEETAFFILSPDFPA